MNATHQNVNTTACFEQRGRDDAWQLQARLLVYCTTFGSVPAIKQAHSQSAVWTDYGKGESLTNTDALLVCCTKRWRGERMSNKCRHTLKSAVQKNSVEGECLIKLIQWQSCCLPVILANLYDTIYNGYTACTQYTSRSAVWKGTHGTMSTVDPKTFHI